MLCLNEFKFFSSFTHECAFLKFETSLHNIDKVVRLIAESESNDLAFFSMKVSIMYRGFESFRVVVIVAVLVLCGVGSGKDVLLSELPEYDRQVFR
jgi:hypothetical protein